MAENKQIKTSSIQLFVNTGPSFALFPTHPKAEAPLHTGVMEKGMFSGAGQFCPCCSCNAFFWLAQATNIDF